MNGKTDTNEENETTSKKIAFVKEIVHTFKNGNILIINFVKIWYLNDNLLKNEFNVWRTTLTIRNTRPK